MPNFHATPHHWCHPPPLAASFGPGGTRIDKATLRVAEMTCRRRGTKLLRRRGGFCGLWFGVLKEGFLKHASITSKQNFKKCSFPFNHVYEQTIIPFSFFRWTPRCDAAFRGLNHTSHEATYFFWMLISSQKWTKDARETARQIAIFELQKKMCMYRL